MKLQSTVESSHGAHRAPDAPERKVRTSGPTGSEPPAVAPNSSGVWLYSAAYFACYVPYSALVKQLSSGNGSTRLSGVAMLPLSVATSALAMMVVMTALGWWKFATRGHLFGRSLPRPSLWTGFSGLATAAIVVTTTLAYAFEGVSIPYVMLLMRGGVLLLAPIVDRLAKRRVKATSWVALALSVVALGDAIRGRFGTALPWLCALDVGVYLLGYFVRLRFMSYLAKSECVVDQKRYFVEEQMVATPAALGFLAILAVLPLPVCDEVRRGFTLVWTHPDAWKVVLIGILSQGTGLFGGLVLLDARENTFCVPLNRASSLLAGIAAACALAVFGGAMWPSLHELGGALLLVLAVVVLAVGARGR